MHFFKKAYCRPRSVILAGAAALGCLAGSPAFATLVDTPLPVTPATTDTDALATTLPAAFQQAGDLTGLSIATDGTTLVVGAPQAAGANVNSYGVNVSTPVPNPIIAAPGKVYVYRHDVNGDWVQVATLVGSNPGNIYNAERFGSSVAVEGGIIVVGADTAKGVGPSTSSKQGRVYLFEEPLGGWTNNTVTTETTELQATILDPLAPNLPIPLDSSNIFFGHSVDISNNTVVVGQWGGADTLAGGRTSKVPAVYIYEMPTAGWASAAVHTQVATLQPPDPNQIYWAPQQFGLSVAIDTDPVSGIQTIVSGGDLIQSGGGAIYLFEQPATAGGWADLAATAATAFDTQAATEAAALGVAAPAAIDPTVAPIPQTLTLGLSLASNAQDGGYRSFGFDVDISGDVIAASGMRFDITPPGGVKVLDAGAVFLYEKDPVNGWPIEETVMLTAPTLQAYQSFGRSLALTDNRIMVGTFTNWGGNADPEPGIAMAALAAGPVKGKAYVFSKPPSSTWANFTAVEEWSSPAGSLDDMFGYSVAASGSTFVAGGFGLDEDLPPGDGILDNDVGSAAVKEATVKLKITNTLPAGTVPQNNDRLTFTIRVESLDLTDTATNVVVTDILDPLGLTYVPDATATQGSCTFAALNPGELVCALGDIPPGGVVDITLVADVVDVNLLNHTASFTADETINSTSTTSNGVNVSPSVSLTSAAVQTVNEGDTVTLSGIGSDADGSIASYLWEQLSGDPVTINNASSATATFTAPVLTTSSTLPLVFRLTATDDGNVSAAVTTTVNVNDVTPPVVTPLDSGPITIKQNQVFSDPGASAVDNFDGPISPVNTDSSAIDNTTIGSYSVVYSATDAAGNTGTANVTVNVIDGIAPTITLNGNDPMEVAYQAAFTDPQAAVTDNVDAETTISGSGTVDTSVLGSYTLTYSATDAAGNNATLTRTVNVVDNEAPSITLLEPTNNPIQINVGDTLTDPGATASDNYDASVTVTATVVSNSAAGSYAITYTATDAAGNTATASRDVEINGLPVVNGTPTATVVAGQSYSFSFTATDVDGDSPLTFSLQGQPAWLSISSSGELSGTPAAADVGSHEGITLTVSDGKGSTVVGPFSVEVTAVQVPTASGGGGGGGAFDPLSLLLVGLLGAGLRSRRRG